MDAPTSITHTSKRCCAPALATLFLILVVSGIALATLAGLRKFGPIKGTGFIAGASGGGISFLVGLIGLRLIFKGSPKDKSLQDAKLNNEQTTPRKSQNGPDRRPLSSSLSDTVPREHGSEGSLIAKSDNPLVIAKLPDEQHQEYDPPERHFGYIRRSKVLFRRPQKSKGINKTLSQNEILQSCGNKINWFTGTTSATLLGCVAYQNIRGGDLALIPTGMLCGAGMIPLAGELQLGLNGINNEHLSGTNWKHVHNCYRYTNSTIDYNFEQSLLTCGNRDCTHIMRIGIALKRIALYPQTVISKVKMIESVQKKWQEPLEEEIRQLNIVLANKARWRKNSTVVSKYTNFQEIKLVKPSDKLELGDLILVGRTSGQTYGVITRVEKTGSGWKYSIFFNPELKCPFQFPSKIYHLPDEPLRDYPSDQTHIMVEKLEAELKEKQEELCILRQAFDEFTNTVSVKKVHPFVAKPFPILIGASKPTDDEHQSTCYAKYPLEGEQWIKGALSFHDYVHVIFTTEEHINDVTLWRDEQGLSFSVLSFSDLEKYRSEILASQSK